MSDPRSMPMVPRFLSYSDISPFYDFRTGWVLANNPAVLALPANPYRVAVGFSIEQSPGGQLLVKPGSAPQFHVPGFFDGFGFSPTTWTMWFTAAEHGPLPAAEWWAFSFAAGFGVSVFEVLWDPTRGR